MGDVKGGKKKNSKKEAQRRQARRACKRFEMRGTGQEKLQGGYISRGEKSTGKTVKGKRGPERECSQGPKEKIFGIRKGFLWGD